MIILENANSSAMDRTKAFRAFAEQQATAEVTVPPLLLPRGERRLYIRHTLIEDNFYRIHNRPEGAQAKFAKLTDSMFSFFRGTALLYYRDYAGSDAHLPTVLTIGDVHPENFGVMPNEDGAPFFGLNDFDEAYFAPFSWDVKRGAVGFNIVARNHGLSRSKRRKIVKAFVKAYLQGLLDFARDDREKWHQYRIDNSPPMIRKLLESARTDRKDFLQKWVDLDKGRFVASKKIVPYSKHIKKFQKIINDYRKNGDFTRSGRAGHFTVKDVAIKKDSGTASLGLDRYFVLIDGATDDPRDDIILELKQTRQSALHGLVPDSSITTKGKAERIVDSHQVHLVGGDPYYGQATIDGESFLVRERSPYKDDIDVDDLNKKELKEYAGICGQTLAQAHARSDEDSGVMKGNAELNIINAIIPKVFCADVARFAEVAVKRIRADYKLFKKDYAKGAFQFVAGSEHEN